MINYPNVEDTSEDLYDVAYRWGWQTSEYKELVYLCYKTPDFAENAHRYYESAEFKEILNILTEMEKEPNLNKNILDFGCGNGVGTYSLARAGYSVTGIDSSLGEIAGLKAAEKLQGLDGVNFTLHRSTSEKLNFNNETFDIVWLREVLHHIHDLESFLKEVFRVLKSNGLVCCFREHVIWNEDQRRHFYSTHPFYPITKDEGCYYLQEYLSAFKAAGFDVEKVIDPVSNIINTYPKMFEENAVFNKEKAINRRYGNDLFTFFARKK